MRGSEEGKLVKKLDVCPYLVECVSKEDPNCNKYKTGCMVYDFYKLKEKGKLK